MFAKFFFKGRSVDDDNACVTVQKYITLLAFVLYNGQWMTM